MLGPDSRLLTALLIAVSAVLLVGVIRWRLLPVRVLAGSLSIVVAMAGGIAVVNDYYGYYTTWGAMWDDLHGGAAGNLGTISATQGSVGNGTLSWVTLPGKLSGYTRRGLLYLPPQYHQARYARVRFPVVELFHGSPGQPVDWETVLHINQVVNSLLARHLIGPMVLVMPAINGAGDNYQDCVNGTDSNDETYVGPDVRADMLARYRVSADPYEWGLAGYSSGGYCAANLALRHRSAYGAAAAIEGYFRAADGPAAAVLSHDPAQEIANSPLYEAERVTANSGPLPAFWVAGGDRDSDYKTAAMFTAALDRVEEVPFVKLDADDNAYAWDAALPAALTWLWQQLAPPDVRVLFPVRAASVTPFSTLYVRPVPHRRPGLRHLKPSLRTEAGSSPRPSVTRRPL